FLDCPERASLKLRLPQTRGPQTQGLGQWRELTLRRHKVGGILIPPALCWGRISEAPNPGPCALGKASCLGQGLVPWAGPRALGEGSRQRQGRCPLR
ncbi:MAG: hypothetical protein DRI61_14970, partial [Chloroflexi bacterium]